ncbi:cardiolipin synthase B, partial [Salmonella enterica subsp. enterica serovar Anatum]|nr:cardiolipin synthase B [Salmonella enterica subsp. enterica serovar Anatum]
AFVGGINYSAEHMSDYGPQAKQDYAVRVEGPVVADILQFEVELLQELQPPVQQVISHCRINYRQLVSADQPGLVLDIAPLSDNE